MRRFVLSLLLLPFGSDAGASPERVIALSEISHVHGIAFDPVQNGPIYLATHHGVFRVDPGGLAIQVSLDRGDYMGFALTANSMWASGHPEGGGNFGVIRSEDRGVSWSVVSPGRGGPVDFHAFAVQVSGRVGYGLYMGSVQVSVDYGATWTVAADAPSQTVDIAIAENDERRLWAATANGVMESRDGGKTWLPTVGDFGRPASTVEAAGNTIYAFVVGMGLAKRQVDDSTWTQLAGNFGDEVLIHLAVSPVNPLSLVAVTQNSLVLSSGDGGTTWVPFQ